MDPSSLAHPTSDATVGVDTHGEVHVAAAFTSDLGRTLGTCEVPTTEAGYRRLLTWARQFGPVLTFGIEGTGSFGAGLARYLRDAGCVVIEVNRPNRQTRRLRGKSDPIDAEAAARAVLAGEATSVAKDDQHHVGMIGTLRVTRRSAVKMRTQVVNQMHALLITAPVELRDRLRTLTVKELVTAARGLRPGPITSTAAATKIALRGLAARHRLLCEELELLDTELSRLTAAAAPALCDLMGVGADVAGALLVAAGDNPERLRSDAAFASLCGVAPVPASSGKTNRHRLSRGGDRHANCALWRVVMVRMSCDQRTRDYVKRRTAEGMSKREIMRCLKRYVAREVFRCLPRSSTAPAT